MLLIGLGYNVNMVKNTNCSLCRDTGMVEILDEQGYGDLDFCSCEMGERKAQEEWVKIDAELDRQFADSNPFADLYDDDPNPCMGTYSEM